ncbi:MAG: hypothetical protein M2R46_03934 [Verrucomicrobia subdivision 3 bacterium]|nr:hypothetical protein [Limisphaerales bacterium]
MSKTNVTRQFIDVTTGQLHLRVAGQSSAKPTVICLHMMPKSGAPSPN